MKHQPDPSSDAEHLAQLRERFNSGEPMKFLLFWGHQHKPNAPPSAACLSQWYEAPFEVGGEHYRTAEHFMMAEKARLFGDAEVHDKIIAAPNPGTAKALGRSIRGFDEALWCQHRLAIVQRGNAAKFAQHEALKNFLVATGDKVLVEASPVDRIWGIGLAAQDDVARNPNLWRGLNLLGFALMQVRTELRG